MHLLDKKAVLGMLWVVNFHQKIKPLYQNGNGNGCHFNTNANAYKRSGYLFTLVLQSILWHLSKFT